FPGPPTPALRPPDATGPPAVAPAQAAGERGPDGKTARTWLSMTEACKLLGVDQTTLRRWSDAGKVPVFRTPGGHRRYDHAALLAFLDHDTRTVPGPTEAVDPGRLTDRSLSAYGARHIEGARERRWFETYSEATLDEHRQLGRRLVDLAIRYATDPAVGQRAVLLRDGEQIANRYGTSGAGAGISISDTIDAFLYFRQPVLQAVMGMIDEERLPAKRVAHLLAEISAFMEHVLVAAVRAHESTPAPRHPRRAAR
ncbi:MAG: helix-turn-helix domain-containing protein, partial [Thermomicrobiales bacterium]